MQTIKCTLLNIKNNIQIIKPYNSFMNNRKIIDLNDKFKKHEIILKL